MPGSRLSDLALSKSIGISRAPIREAFGQLERDGLVRQVPHHGTFVRRLSLKELADLYDLRLLLETDAVGKCAASPSRALLKQLEDNNRWLDDFITTQRQASPPAAPAMMVRALVKRDFSFHMHILRAAGNQAIVTVATQSRVLINLMSHNHLIPADGPMDIPRRTHQEHAAIIEALRQGKAQAARDLMHAHIEAAKLRVLSQYREQGLQAVAAGPSA